MAAEQPEKAYRPLPAELSLAEIICMRNSRKVARDNTVKYRWRVLQLLPGSDRPSYADLRVDVLERADGELMLRYQGQAVDFQEGEPSSSSLWGATNPISFGPEPQPIVSDTTNGHLNGGQRALLDTLEPTNEE